MRLTSLELADLGELDEFDQDRRPNLAVSGRATGRLAGQRQRPPRSWRNPDSEAPPPRPGRPPDGRESFKCGQCRAFVGPTISGGRHRNHCPICLTSRHVDDRRPGDRASSCRSLMTAVGTFFRPKGEQVILHRCRGCGVERFNRVAADDHPIPMMRLPLVEPRVASRPEGDSEIEPIAADRHTG